MKLNPASTLAALFLLGCTVTLAASAPPRILEPRPGQQPWQEALDWGFVFASSIHTDRKDMGKAQQAVALAYAEMGDLTVAAERAEKIEGWRRSVVFAELAREAAAAGKASVARGLIGKAEGYAASVNGWQRKRIDAHIANALALLGDKDSSERLAADLATNDPRQYTGRSAAAVAVGFASRGEFDQAIAGLASLDAVRDFDIAWWRTVGYLEVAEVRSLTPEQRKTALDKASVSAEGVDGWKGAEGKLLAAGQYLDHGHKKDAARAADAAEAAILDFGDHNPVKPTFLGRLAELRFRLGAEQKANRLMAAGMALVPTQLAIDIPGIYAAMAASYKAIDAGGQSAEVFDRAIDAAVKLENSRPRALSMTSICVQLGRSSTVLDAATRARLAEIYAGLGDPW